MGRMLETLKPGFKPLAEQCVVDWTLREPEEVPYIEVGSGKKVEGSSQVMAVKHAAQLHMQPPHLQPPPLPADKSPTEKNLVAATNIVQLPEAKPMAVVCEPWPAMLVPSRGVASEVIAFHQPNHAISKQYAALFGKIL